MEFLTCHPITTNSIMPTYLSSVTVETDPAKALAYYIKRKNPGPVLREIFERELQKAVDNRPKERSGNPVRFGNVIFPSVACAASILRICRTTLNDDIKNKAFNYKVYPI